MLTMCIDLSKSECTNFTQSDSLLSLGAQTHTDKYLNFDSHHPVHVKKGVVKCLYNRAKKIDNF